MPDTFDAHFSCAGISTDASYVPTHLIAENQSHSADAAAHSGGGLTMTIEGEDLLIALKHFAASLVPSPNGQQIEQQLPVNLDQVQGVSF